MSCQKYFKIKEKYYSCLVHSLFWTAISCHKIKYKKPDEIGTKNH